MKLVLTIVAFLITAAIMFVMGKGLDWFFTAIPLSVMTLIVGAMGGLCVGGLLGFRDAEKHFGVGRFQRPRSPND